MRPRAILETSVYARDLTAARRFYTEVLGLELFTERTDRHLFYRCGDGMFLVFNPDITMTEETIIGGGRLPLHGVAGPTHMAFVMTEAEVEPWRKRLAEAGVPIESEVVWPNGGLSFYFRDPAGNILELATPRLWDIGEEAFA